ncbi:MAG: hypothetical protein C4523_09830 [Myxococcales bacterium]|nr:MAG: hypothetical protein C4523_09830 [Myxococcales bacterium]
MGFILLLGAALGLAWAAFRPDPNLAALETLAGVFDMAVSLDNPIRPPALPVNQPVLANGEAGLAQMRYDSLGLSQGPFVAIRRSVEVYSWKETPREITATQSARPSLEERFVYTTEWTANPVDWRDLHSFKDRQFEIPSFKNQDFLPRLLSVGRLEIDPVEVEFLGWEDYNLNSGELEVLDRRPHDAKYVYSRADAPQDPHPGDWRFSYQVVRLDHANPEITVLGSLERNRLVPYLTPGGKKVFLIATGPPSRLRSFLHDEIEPLRLAGSYDVFLLGLAVILGLAALIGLVWRLRPRPAMEA